MFDSFISLGYSCHTSASMAKYGLRAFSGPFDWLITENFPEVLHFLETDFADFLQQNRMIPYSKRPKEFQDQKSGFVFLHEEKDYRSGFEDLEKKYARRIQKFIQTSHQKTCFLRSVAEQRELDYVKEHATYVRQVVQKNNLKNEIVFLTRKGLRIPGNFPFHSYQIEGVFDGSQRYLLRGWFDENPEFVEFCVQNYSKNALVKNLIFDAKEEFREQQNVEKRFQTIFALCDHDFSRDKLPPEVIIYGAGRIGKELYKKIKPFTKVRCFVDRNEYGLEFQGIPICALDDRIFDEKAVMIVSTTYDFEKIEASVRKRCKDVDVISLDTLIGV